MLSTTLLIHPGNFDVSDLSTLLTFGHSQFCECVSRVRECTNSMRVIHRLSYLLSHAAVPTDSRRHPSPYEGVCAHVEPLRVPQAQPPLSYFPSRCVAPCRMLRMNKAVIDGGRHDLLLSVSVMLSRFTCAGACVNASSLLSAVMQVNTLFIP